MNHKEPNIGEHLAFFSVKYGVFLSELYQTLVSAREIGKSTCEELTVEYRGSINDKAIFLITKGNAVVVQFRVPEDFLIRQNICFERWLDTDKVRKQVAKQNSGQDSAFIQNLRHGMKKVNLKAEVLETCEPQMINTQYGNRVLLTNIWIADETGKIKLCLWGEQITSLFVGDIVQITNATVRAFKGDHQLSLGRNGTFNILQTNTSKTEQQQKIVTQEPVYA